MLKKILVASIAAGSIVACSSNKAPVAPVASAPAPAPVVTEVVVEQPAPVMMNHNSVYFAFDKYDVKNDYAGLLKANSDYLVANAQSKVQVQGNTDDIGSVEYNLALGQRRATATKKALIAGGAGKAQVEAVSYGKLKPKYANDTAANRAQNRRADIVYTAMQPAGYSLDSNNLPMVDATVYSGTVVTGVE